MVLETFDTTVVICNPCDFFNPCVFAGNMLFQGSGHSVLLSPWRLLP